ncbi:MAG: adenylate/guanylate cyclase domain-containing protein [Actinomycetota bacterium]
MESGAPATTVQCVSCGHENREGARFCAGCGAALATTVACPSCGAEHPRDERFCDECGAQLTGSRSAREAGEAPAPPSVKVPEHLSDRMRQEAPAHAGERKQVTVLFADVMGSMDLAERIDPERWRQIMDRFFQLLADAVHRFEGTVDKFTGDGIMALFGAPIAHEDHAQRACYAALDMQRTVGEYAGELRRADGVSLTTRIGVNSGEVVVGSIGDDLSLSYTAVGHTVGLAQRMESLAEPGKAYLTRYAARLVEGFVELRDLGDFEVKGVSHSLQVFELQGVGRARGRIDVSRARGFSRFVGRTGEMTQLEAELERVIAGDGAVVGIVGEPGIGKSRLCHEFAELCRRRGISVYEAQCQAHGKAIPLLPVLQSLRAYFGIEEEDPDRRVREKIAGRLLLLEEGFNEDLPLVFDFLGVPDPERPAPQMNPEARQRRLLDVLRRIVQSPERQEASVNLIEDLHWIDPASDAFLASFVESLPGASTLVVLNFRPEYRADWMRRSYYRQIPLAPLGAEAIEELLVELIGSDPSLDGLSELIRSRTGGNPFFVEEVVRELAESGALEGERGAYRLAHAIDEIAVPATVESILAARIDRLGEPAKGVLGAAAVVGKDFERSLLARAVEIPEGELDAALRDLIAGEFIYQAALYPEPEYAFRHPLIREVALGSQLAQRRAVIHRRVAEAIQEVSGERIDEQAALVAQHYEEAGEAMDAARWHARAAGWLGFKDPAAASLHWERVRELDPELPDGEEADGLRSAARLMILAMAWRLGADIEDQRQVFAEGKAIAERTGDLAMLALLYGGMGIAVGTCAGDVREFVALASEAARLGTQIEDPGAKVAVAGLPMYALFLAGRHEEALASLDRILELTVEDPNLGAGVVVANPRAWATSFRALPLMAMGRFEEARRAIAEGSELCRRWDRESLGWTHTFHCSLAVWGGEPGGPEAIAHGRQAVEIAEAIGDSFSRVVASSWLGLAHGAVGDAAEARDLFRHSLEMIEELGAGKEFEPSVRSGLAHALAALGENDRAVEECELAIDLAGKRGVANIAPAVRLTLAEILIERDAPGDLGSASSLLDEAEQMARELGQLPHVGRSLGIRARLLDRLGDPEGRDRARAEAISLGREMDARGLLADLEAEAASATA